MDNKAKQSQFIILPDIIFRAICNTSTAQAAAFNLQLASSNLSTKQGESVALEVSISATSGFNAPINVSLEHKPNPAGVTGILSCILRYTS